MKTQFLCTIFIAGILSAPVSSAQTRAQNEGFLINSKPQGATVYIEGEMVGKTPCRFPFKLTDRYRLTAEIGGYEKWSRIIEFSRLEQDAISIPLLPKRRMKSMMRSLVIPGWGQHYAERKVQGKIYFSLQMASLVSLGISQIHYKDCLDEYNDASRIYSQASRSYHTGQHYWQELNNAHTQLENAHNYRQAILYSTVCIYLINILDSMFFFPKNIRKIEIFGFSIFEPQFAVKNSRLVFSCSF